MKLLTTKELTNTLNIHSNTVYKYIDKGMPYLKFDKEYRFDLDMIIEWLNERNKENK